MTIGTTAAECIGDLLLVLNGHRTIYPAEMTAAKQIAKRLAATGDRRPPGNITRLSQQDALRRHAAMLEDGQRALRNLMVILAREYPLADYDEIMADAVNARRALQYESDAITECIANVFRAALTTNAASA